MNDPKRSLHSLKNISPNLNFEMTTEFNPKISVCALEYEWEKPWERGCVCATSAVLLPTA